MSELNNQPDNSDNWPEIPNKEDPRKRKELEATYARVFKPGSDGFVVLGDLMARYLFSIQDSNSNHAYFAGQSSVMKYTQSMIQAGKEL